MKSIIKYVYISDDFRRAMDKIVKGAPRKGQYGWPEFDKDFKLEYKDAREREEFMIQYCHRPKSSYISDALGVDEYVWNMDNMEKYYPVLDYKYYPEVENADFNDLMIKRAEELRDMGKHIEVFYSGGVDSTAMLYALREVCPREQLHIIAGGDAVIKHYPKLWEDYVIKGPHRLDMTGNIYGMANPDTNVYTSGCEADRLFGSVGYPPQVDDAVRDPNKALGYAIDPKKKPNLDDPENDEWNYEMWWTITRYTFITQSFRFLQNIKADEIDLENYQPFFRDPDIHKWAINQHYNRNMFWYNHSPRSDPERFQKAKMMLRDFIAQYDKEYAYGIGKTRLMEGRAQKEFYSPLPNDFRVKAITSKGTVVHKDNIMDYLNHQTLCLTPHLQ
jgi:hypothetical protein